MCFGENLQRYGSPSNISVAIAFVTTQVRGLWLFICLHLEQEVSDLYTDKRQKEVRRSGAATKPRRYKTKVVFCLSVFWPEPLGIKHHLIYRADGSRLVNCPTSATVSQTDRTSCSQLLWVLQGT